MKIEKLANDKFIIEKTKEMIVPVILYCSNNNISSILSDNSINQIVNVASLPGIINYAIAMPDIHQGYGFPIGTVAAFDDNEGIVCPGGVGFDINCGIRLIKTNLYKNEITKEIDKITSLLFNSIPSGVGSQGIKKFDKNEIKRISENGIKWMIENGFAHNYDIDNIEDNGLLRDADTDILSKEAIERGRTELGTLGAGNHFLELGYISEIFDKQIANDFGIFLNQVVIWIHTGSRGFGHQIAREYIDKMRKKMIEYGIKLKDPDLVYLPVKDQLSIEYISAMKSAANYAYCNRQLITHYVRQSFEKAFNKSFEKLGIYILYDVCHNIAKFENHLLNGKEKKVLIHRKGATRSFPARNKSLPEKFKKIGQPVLVPGDMQRGSYILIGTEQSMNQTFGSVSHGAGRLMSRNQAKKSFSYNSIENELKNKNILLMAKDKTLVQEEAPSAYKNINDIIEVLTTNNLAKVVAKSLPLSVIKG